MPTVTSEAQSRALSQRKAVVDRERPRVLIGPSSNDPTESVSCVNAAFVEGLKESYAFHALDATRQYGGTRQSMFNGVNLFYFLQQFSRWLAHLVRHRPHL